MLAEVNDPKVAYTFHSYEPLIFTHQGAYWVDGMPSDFRIAYPNTIETVSYTHLDVYKRQLLDCFTTDDGGRNNGMYDIVWHQNYAEITYRTFTTENDKKTIVVNFK